MKTTIRFAAIAATLFCTLSAGHATHAAAGLASTDGWWSDVYEEKTVKLSDILRAPNAYRGLDVSFVVQFHSVGSLENPYYTRFEKERYLNVAVWGDEAQLWEKSAYEETFPYLFIDRIEEAAQVFLTARRYQRFVVTGRVESVFRGKPWIEVVGLQPLDTAMTEPSLVHLVKAHKLKSHRRWDAAAAEFKLAHAKTLPPHVTRGLFEQEGVCLAAADRHADAVVALQQALALAPEDERLKEMVAHCQETVQLAKKKTPAVAGEKTPTDAPAPTVTPTSTPEPTPAPVVEVVGEGDAGTPDEQPAPGTPEVETPKTDAPTPAPRNDETPMYPPVRRR